MAREIIKTARMTTQTVTIICPDCDEPISNPVTYSHDWTGEDIARAQRTQNFLLCACGTKVRVPKTVTFR